MSSENIETLQRFYDEFNRSGRADLEIFANEVVWHQPDEIAGGMGTYHGHGGVRQAIREMRLLSTNSERYQRSSSRLAAAASSCRRATRASDAAVVPPSMNPWGTCGPSATEK